MSLFVVCGVCAGGDASAQTRKQTIAVGWGVDVPLGDKFIDKVGANLSAGWSYRIIPSLSLGVTAGYSSGCEKGRGDEFFEGSLISGERRKELCAVPLLVRMEWFPVADRITTVAPFFGVGAGAQYAGFDIEGESIVKSAASGWSESFSVYAGGRMFLERYRRFFLDAECSWNYAGNGWPQAEIESLQRLGVSLGVGVAF